MNKTAIAVAVTVAFFGALDKLDDTAAKVKATWRKPEEAKLALIPTFAKHAKLKNAVARNDDGEVIGWNGANTNKKVKALKNRLTYLLGLAYGSKKKDSDTKGTSDWMRCAISLSKLNEAGFDRAVSKAKELRK